MGRGFVVGFLTASLLWAAAAALVLVGPYRGLLTESDGGEGEADAGAIDAAPAADASVRRRRRRRRRGARRRARRREAPPARDGRIEVGDDLDEGAPREIDMSAAGGEARLSPAQIDAAFGRGMPGIRRCLLLLEGDQRGAGRVVFGMRVNGSGRVVGSRLSGPAHLVSGPVGQCLRQRARALTFPSFDGAETTFSYPVTFE